jgi:hypothetical protein
MNAVARFMGVLVNRRLSGAAALALILIAGLSCSDKSVTGPDGLTTNGLSADDNRVIATVQVTLASTTIDVGQTTQATVVFLDKYGRVLKRTVAWSTSDPAIATVDTAGLVRARAPGTVSVIATHNSHSGSAQLAVNGTVSTAPVASVSVTLASSSLNPGQTTQASATLRDANNNVLSGRAIAWSSSNTTVATVTSTGLVAAVTAGTAQIMATSEGQSASAALSVQGLPPPTVSGSSNEPTSMNLVTDRPFNLLHELGWDEPTNGQPVSNISILADATAPKSPINAMRFIYRAGTSGGSAPWDADSPPFAYKTVYVSHWARVSSNWQGHPGSSINKMYYLYTSTDIPSIVIVLWGANSEPLRPFVEGQNIVSGGQGSADPQNPDWGPNLVPTAEAKRGQWFHIEVVAKMNTLGNADGFIDLWLDGVHVTHVANVKFQNTPPNWRSLHLAPVWGGGGGTVANTMYMDFDDVYVSGKN